MSLLIRSGADPQRRSASGSTALALARKGQIAGAAAVLSLATLEFEEGSAAQTRSEWQRWSKVQTEPMALHVMLRESASSRRELLASVQHDELLETCLPFAFAKYPLDTASAPDPSSRAATRSSKTATVGLEMRL